jgi:thiosulfate reductase cytochrome b subunit
MNPDDVPLHLPKALVQPGDWVKRHRLSTRIWHWVNAAALLILLMSGLMIFNAHPRLYWGQKGADTDRAWLEIGSEQGSAQGKGYVQIGGSKINTAGVLGSYVDGDGEPKQRAFPYWATIPSDYNLSTARLWHFAFAWILSLALLFYIVRALWNGHIIRDLHVKMAQWSPRHIWHDITEHARLRFPTGTEALQYGILQKLSYIGVIFILIPLMIFTGLSMSPGMDAAWPWMIDLFGGRQSARSIHFIAASALLAFFFIHMAMVLLSGPYNQVRAIITGRFRVPGKLAAEEPALAASAPIKSSEEEAL